MEYCQFQVINLRNVSRYVVILVIVLSLLMTMKAEAKIYKGNIEKNIKHRIESLEKCNMSSFLPPVPSQIESYYKAHCIVIDNNERVCKAIDDDGNGSIILFNSHGRSTKIAAHSYLGDTEDFEVLKKDFDLDGNKELIIVNHDSTTMGMAVAYWSVLIFDGRTGHEQIPLGFEVQDYGQRIFVHESGGDKCLILSTAWSDGANKKGFLGSYFVGHLYEYHLGKLVIANKYPILARRYLNSFNEDRAAADSLQWIKSKYLEFRTMEPTFDRYRKISMAGGIVESIELKNDTREQRYYVINIRDAQGHLESYTYFRAGEGVSGHKHLKHIGEARSGRFYPADYEPSNFKKEWINRRVSIGRYKEKYNNVIDILWFK